MRVRCVEGEGEEGKGEEGKGGLIAAEACLARAQTEAGRAAVLTEAEERRRSHNMEGELEREEVREGGREGRGGAGERGGEGGREGGERG